MTNLFIDNYRFLARYNRWINQRLYVACDRLTYAQRNADQGAFFKSVHRTLTHLVLADKMWLADMQPEFLTNTVIYSNTKGVQRAPGMASVNALF